MITRIAKSSIEKLIWLIIAMLLGGCATGYNEHGFLGGYKDRMVEEDVFEVSFAGNGFVDPKRAEDFALLRCASLTLEHRCKYFAVLDRLSQKQFFNTKPVETMLIQCFEEEPETSEKKIYDAEKIKLEIQNKYKIKS
jgi:hypothetical protein